MLYIKSKSIYMCLDQYCEILWKSYNILRFVIKINTILHIMTLHVNFIIYILKIIYKDDSGIFKYNNLKYI